MIKGEVQEVNLPSIVELSLVLASISSCYECYLRTVDLPLPGLDTLFLGQNRLLASLPPSCINFLGQESHRGHQQTSAEVCPT